MPDQCLKVLVFDYRTLESAAALPDKVEGLSDVKGLAAIRGTSAAIAVTDELEKSGGPFDIVHGGVFGKKDFYFFILGREQIVLRQLQFFVQVFVVEFILFQILFQDEEFIPAV